MASATADDVNNNGNDLVHPTLSQSPERQEIVIRYDISKKHLLILVGLNHKYVNKTIVSNLYYDWSRRLTPFYVRCQCFCHSVTDNKIRSEDEGLN